jgi:hypothetical protein
LTIFRDQVPKVTRHEDDPPHRNLDRGTGKHEAPCPLESTSRTSREIIFRMCVCVTLTLCVDSLAFWTTNYDKRTDATCIGIFPAAKMRLLQQQHRHNKGTRHSYIFYIVLLKCNSSVVVAILQNIHRNEPFEEE